MCTEHYYQYPCVHPQRQYLKRCQDKEGHEQSCAASCFGSSRCGGRTRETHTTSPDHCLPCAAPEVPIARTRGRQAASKYGRAGNTNGGIGTSWSHFQEASSTCWGPSRTGSARQATKETCRGPESSNSKSRACHQCAHASTCTGLPNRRSGT